MKEISKHSCPTPLTFDRFVEIVSPESHSILNVLSMNKDLTVDVNLMGFNIGVIDSHPILQIQDYRIGFVRSGRLKVRINLIDKELFEETMVFLAPGSIFQPQEVSDDFAVCGMVVSPELMNMATGGHMPSFLDGKQMDGQLPVSSEECSLLRSEFQLLLSLIQKERPNRQGQLSMISVILSEFELMFESQSMFGQKGSHEQNVFNRFINLVNKHSRQEHQLSFYADKMCLSERYLGTLIKKASSVSAKDWIDRSLITAAKILLKHSDKTSAEIAEELNFPNASFFAKYFKRLTGTTPMAYRKD